MAGVQAACSGSSAVPSACSTSAFGGIDCSILEQQCPQFLVHGLAASTRKSYTAGQKKFINFCTQLGKLHSSGSPCPVDKWTLCFFATFLAGSLRHSSIKVYLSAVRSLHIDEGFLDPLLNCLRLQRVVRGIKRAQGSSSYSRLPITDGLMMVIFKSLDLSVPDHCMFWAACTLAAMPSSCTYAHIRGLGRSLQSVDFLNSFTWIWTSRGSLRLTLRLCRHCAWP